MNRALPITTTLLLDSLRDETRPDGWELFTSRYWPVLAGFAAKLGLSEADAADAAQWTLTEFLTQFRAGKYERGRGRLSSYVIGIARHRILMIRRALRKGQPDENEPDALPDDVTLTDIWERERRRVILDQALESLRASEKLAPATLAAFELVALRGVPPEEAARQTGLSVSDVYVARSRCTRRLREIAASLTAAWTEDE